jgi:signal peptidase II
MIRFHGKISFVGLALAIIVFVADQWSKNALLHYIVQNHPPVPVTSFFNLVFVQNEGITFGMLNGTVLPPYTLTILSSVVALILLIWLLRTPSLFIGVALGLLLGGAAGNILDRIQHGAVTDFLDFHAFGWHWPAFNVADAAIVVGVGLLLLQSLAFDRKPRQS